MTIRKRVDKLIYSKKDHEEKHPFFCQVEEIIDDQNALGILVKCKLCDNWFKPKRKQLERRIQALEKPKRFEQNYFYCSDECKNNCPLHNVKFDPYEVKNNVNKAALYELKIWSDRCFKIQFQELGYNKCEICGSIENLAAHHIEPKKIMPGYALDPVNGIIFCRDCHLGKSHIGKCSTGSLANIMCKNI